MSCTAMVSRIWSFFWLHLIDGWALALVKNEWSIDWHIALDLYTYMFMLLRWIKYNWIWNQTREKMMWLLNQRRASNCNKCQTKHPRSDTFCLLNAYKYNGTLSCTGADTDMVTFDLGYYRPTSVLCDESDLYPNLSNVIQIVSDRLVSFVCLDFPLPARNAWWLMFFAWWRIYLKRIDSFHCRLLSNGFSSSHSKLAAFGETNECYFTFLLFGSTSIASMSNFQSSATLHVYAKLLIGSNQW